MSDTAQLETRPDSSLLPSRPSRIWGGFDNLLRKELGLWWRTKLWWIQTLIWVGLINGVSTIVALYDEGMTASEHFIEAIRTPFLMGAVVLGIGVVVTVQSAIVGEKDHGTAAWVMSKPVSRVSFVMSKTAAHSFGFLVTGVAIPAAIHAATAATLFPGMLNYGDYAAAVAVLALSVIFYVALTICLGTLFDGRGPVAGIGIAFILTGQFFSGMLPGGLVMRTPWPLGELAASYAVNAPPDWSRLTPISATIVGVALLCVTAVWRFRRDEF